MHIGIDARLTYYRIGGISTYIRRLVEALETLDSQNRYTIFHSRKMRESLVKRFESAKLWTPAHYRWERVALSVELARFRLDLLHSPDFIPPFHGAHRHVITVHDLTFLHYPEYLTADSRRYYNDQILQATRRADHILADSEATKTDLVTMLNVPPQNVTVHMLGVDESFKPLPVEMSEKYCQELELPTEYLLFVGTFEPRKNILGLLEAYHQLASQMREIPALVLVGKRGWLFDETMARIHQMGLDKQIIWRDNVSDEQLPAVYNRALTLITPSFYEGFGLPALEAMACGTVPIVSNRSSLPEIVGDVGLQIDPDHIETLTQALQRVLTDTEWRARMEKAGLARAALFTWDNTARIVQSVYQSVL